MANEAQKISGYLEKKGKLRMVSSWKKYWFVLEGRLLLYYRSRAEYDAISPCKGSITLGPPCSIKPACASSCVFQIETRANTINLRAENRCEQEKWMQAILATLNQNSSNSTKMTHFRYSSDNLVPTPTTDKKKTKLLTRQNTLPERLNKISDKPMVERLQSLGAQTYGGSLQTINKLSQRISPNLPKNNSLKRLLMNSNQSVNEEKNLYAQISKDSKSEEVLIENEHYSRSLKREEDSVIVENEAYARHPTKEAKHNQKPKDHIYHSIDTNRSFLMESQDYHSIDPIYTIPNLDHNENKLEQAYAVSKIYDVPFPESDNTKIYSEPETEPELPPRPKLEDETSSVDSTEIKNKKKSKIKQLARMVSEGKRSGSKRNSFVFRMMKKIRKGDKKEEEEAVIVAAAPTEENKIEKPDEIVMLGELQKLLDNKKQIIEKQLSGMTPNDTSPPKEDNQNKGNGMREDGASDDVFPSKVTEAPTLPCKQKFIPDLIMEYTELKCNNALNIPRPKLIPKTKKIKQPVTEPDDKLKTIDEILDDLENEKSEQDSRQKVKVLIERFNETSNYDDVELRKKKKEEDDIDDVRHSDDLNLLLAELTKVTNATILTTGGTSSLISTPLTDDEWKDLIPIRTRRFSEPDYDIPRPHSLLHIIPQKEEKSDSPLEPTRFFGPVLLTPEPNNRRTNEKVISITPDSLEIENLDHSKHTYNSSIEEDRSLFSYTSHNYSKEIKLPEQSNHEPYYPSLQSFASLHMPVNECEHMRKKQEEYIIDNVEDRSEFMDSLEPCDHQSSTPF